MDEDQSRSDDDNTSEMEASDAEGVWSPDIEQSFQEALIMYPPCGRRKIILTEEGKMYGRNELIAKYIKMRTSKTRTRKQVSSHIQVLARKKSREYQSKIKDHTAKEKVMQVMSTMSSAQIVSAMTSYPNRPLPGMGHGPASSPYSNGSLWQPGLMPNSVHQDIKPCIGNLFYDRSSVLTQNNSSNNLSYDGRSVASNKLRLIDFVSFVSNPREPEAKHVFVEIGPSSGTDAVLETIDIRQFYDKFPEKNGGLRDLYERGPTNAFFLVKFWADINCADMDANSFYGFSSMYESSENMPVQCSNKACSYGKQVVELETEVHGALEGGRYVYRIQRSQMCEYMMNFILKLKDLPDRYSMNTVLENFTILQVISNQDTHETLLCLAFMFEVSNTDHGSGNSAHIYRLVKD